MTSPRSHVAGETCRFGRFSREFAEERFRRRVAKSLRSTASIKIVSIGEARLAGHLSLRHSLLFLLLYALTVRPHIILQSGRTWPKKSLIKALVWHLGEGSGEEDLS